jgi:hypothetical protein
MIQINKSAARGIGVPNCSNSRERTISMCIYLYVKTHNITGLKYLGQTRSKNPHTYAGSGTYWLRHLNVHGKDYSTEILKECQTLEELKIWGQYYSKLWNVVENKEWANLTEENGRGGKTVTNFHHSVESKQAISDARKGIQFSEEHLSKLKNREFSDDHKNKLKAARAKQVISPETKAKMRDAQLKRWSLRKQVKLLSSNR